MADYVRSTIAQPSLQSGQFDQLVDECENIIHDQIAGIAEKNTLLDEKIGSLGFDHLSRLQHFNIEKGQGHIAALGQKICAQSSFLRFGKNWVGFCGLQLLVLGSAIKLGARATQKFGPTYRTIAVASLGLTALFINGFYASYLWGIAKITSLGLRFEKIECVNSAQSQIIAISDQLAKCSVMSFHQTMERMQQQLDHLSAINSEQVKKISSQNELIEKHASVIKALKTTIGIGVE